MDTRRLPAPTTALGQPLDAELPDDVEIVELSAVVRPRRVSPLRVMLVIAIVMLAGVVAVKGIPSRSGMAFDTPLPNLFAQQPAP